VAVQNPRKSEETELSQNGILERSITDVFERRTTMLLIRDIMYCKPGKVRPMVEKFLAISKLSEKKGMGKMRVLTDVSAERYWTVVGEFEVPSLDAFMKMMQDPEAMKEFEPIMKGYHDLVEMGRREIYTIEG
jgi:hypothetical protein